MDVLLSGSLAYDKIMNFPGKFSDHILPQKVHSLNVSFGIEKFTVQYGGTAGNIGYNLALFKEKPYIISQVGSDFTTYKKHLLQHGIQLKLVNTLASTTCATAHIITDQNDNQITGFHFGAMQYQALKNPSVKKNLTTLISKTHSSKSGASLGLLAPGNTDDMMQLATLYQKYNVPYIFDPGQQTVWLTAEQIRTLIKGASILIVNDYELAMIEKKLNTSKNIIKSKLDKLIVTLGPKGAYWYSQGILQKMPAVKPKKVVDPTGAGDAYRAGLIKGVIQQWDDATAGRVAALCATYAIEQYGTQNHAYTVTQFKQRYKQVFKKLLKI